MYVIGSFERKLGKTDKMIIKCFDKNRTYMWSEIFFYKQSAYMINDIALANELTLYQ